MEYNSSQKKDLHYFTIGNLVNGDCFKMAFIGYRYMFLIDYRAALHDSFGDVTM